MTDIRLRRATQDDAAVAAEVWLRSYAAALPSVRRTHTDDEVRGYFRDVLIPHQETWLAVSTEGAEPIVGLLVLRGKHIDQLYLDPDWRGRGIGDTLVEHAKNRRPGGLELWTFQVNRPARRFYQRHGFVEVERTDGRGNQEREPDVRYVWRPGYS